MALCGWRSPYDSRCSFKGSVAVSAASGPASFHTLVGFLFRYLSSVHAGAYTEQRSRQSCSSSSSRHF